ncbi:MAG: transposase, partial [Akkermansia sp.]|nr:transposase [Akkermansia sp.]
DAGTGCVHTLVGTAANVHGSQAAAALIRDGDHVVYGDSGYPGVEKQAAVKDDPHLSTVEFRVNKRPKSIRENTPGTNWEKAIERGKSRRWLQSQGLLFSVSLTAGNSRRR